MLFSKGLAGEGWAATSMPTRYYEQNRGVRRPHSDGGAGRHRQRPAMGGKNASAPATQADGAYSFMGSGQAQQSDFRRGVLIQARGKRHRQFAVRCTCYGTIKRCPLISFNSYFRESVMTRPNTIRTPRLFLGVFSALTSPCSSCLPCFLPFVPPPTGTKGVAEAPSIFTSLWPRIFCHAATGSGGCLGGLPPGGRVFAWSGEQRSGCRGGRPQGPPLGFGLGSGSRGGLKRSGRSGHFSPPLHTHSRQSPPSTVEGGGGGEDNEDAVAVWLPVVATISANLEGREGAPRVRAEPSCRTRSWVLQVPPVASYRARLRQNHSVGLRPRRDRQLPVSWENGGSPRPPWHGGHLGRCWCTGHGRYVAVMMGHRHRPRP